MKDQILDRYAADILNRLTTWGGLNEGTVRQLLRKMGVELAAAIIGSTHEVKTANDLTRMLMETVVGQQKASAAHHVANKAIETVEDMQLNTAARLLDGFTADDIIAAAKYRGDQQEKSRRDDLVLEKTQNLVLHGKDATYPAGTIPLNTDGVASGRFSHREREGQGPNYGVGGSHGTGG